MTVVLDLFAEKQLAELPPGNEEARRKIILAAQRYAKMGEGLTIECIRKRLTRAYLAVRHVPTFRRDYDNALSWLKKGVTRPAFEAIGEFDSYDPTDGEGG